MKKFTTALVLATVIVTGCGNEASTEENQGSAQVEAAAGITVNGQFLEIGMNITDDIINAIGTPLSVQTAPSCHYDGEDTIYSFEDVTLYVYKDGDKNRLYIVELVSENVTSPEGFKVGMTLEEVNTIDPNNTHEGLLVSYSYDNYDLDVTLTPENTVAYIEIFEKQ